MMTCLRLLKSIVPTVSKLLSVTAGIALTMAVASCDICALAYNQDYLQSEKWVANKNVQTSGIDIEGDNGVLKGSVQYFLDEREYCIYLNFSFSEDNISPDACIKFSFKVTDGTETYQFEVDENGMCDSTGQENELFTVASNFSTYTEFNGSYIIAMDIHNGSPENYITVHISVNGHKYLIMKNVPMVLFQETEPAKTTAVKTKTSATRRETSTKSTTTAQNKKDTAAAKTTTTKFYAPIVIDKETTTAANPTEYVSDTDSTENMTHYNKEPTVEITTASKIWLVSGIGIAVIGMAFILTAKFRKDKKENKEDESYEL